MTLLSDRTLLDRLRRGTLRQSMYQILVDPLISGAVQPCSVDVHLGSTLLRYEGDRLVVGRDSRHQWNILPLVDDTYWLLEPGRFYLGVTLERLGIPIDLCGNLIGISSRARDGVVIHQQAGLLDPGYTGHPTLEITVVGAPTEICPGCRIGQVTFTQLDRPARDPYDGRYQGDTQPEPART